MAFSYPVHPDHPCEFRWFYTHWNLFPYSQVNENPGIIRERVP